MSDIGDLGAYGELKFRSWCRSMGLVVNPSSEQDDTGWDCKVEFKSLLKDSNSNPLEPEHSLSHPVFDIQVKTSQNDNNKWSIKIEHLIRFIHSPNPAFLCIINADLKNDKVNYINLIHIDNSHIENILKKQRKIMANGSKIKGHTVSINGMSPIN